LVLKAVRYCQFFGKAQKTYAIRKQNRKYAYEVILQGIQTFKSWTLLSSYLSIPRVSQLCIYVGVCVFMFIIECYCYYYGLFEGLHIITKSILEFACTIDSLSPLPVQNCATNIASVNNLPIKSQSWITLPLSTMNKGVCLKTTGN